MREIRNCGHEILDAFKKDEIFNKEPARFTLKHTSWFSSTIVARRAEKATSVGEATATTSIKASSSTTILCKERTYMYIYHCVNKWSLTMEGEET